MRVDNGRVRIWKEAVVAYFKAVLWNLLGGSEENMKNFNQNSQCSGLDLNLTPPE
jgi:hypothetical protein